MSSTIHLPASLVLRVHQDGSRRFDGSESARARREHGRSARRRIASRTRPGAKPSQLCSAVQFAARAREPDRDGGCCRRALSPRIRQEEKQIEIAVSEDFFVVAQAQKLQLAIIN